MSTSECERRSFAVDVLVCDACGGSMRILAVLPWYDAHMSEQRFDAVVIGPGFKIDQQRIIDSIGALALDAVPARMINP